MSFNVFRQVVFSFVNKIFLLQYNSKNSTTSGTFPRESRPKDLLLVNETTILQKASDVELNGLAIKERLMASRLPESCV